MSELVATLVHRAKNFHHIPGAIEFRSTSLDVGREVAAGFAFVCPCGCGNEGWLPVVRGEARDHRWGWDGNSGKPTLTPSVLQTGCQWHGHLTAGVWRTA